jgi:hypothetical protein
MPDGVRLHGHLRLVYAAAALLCIGVLLCGCGPNSGRAIPDNGPTRRPTRPVPPIPAPDPAAIFADVAATKTSAFEVSYRLDGDFELDSVTVAWSNPRLRVDTTYDGVALRTYTDMSTGRVTVCALITATLDCGADVVPQTAQTHAILAALVPPTAGDAVGRAVQMPGAKTSTREIAGEQADCVATPEGFTYCLASTGAVLLARLGPPGSTQIEATSHKDSVDLAALVPPDSSPAAQGETESSRSSG